MPLPTDAQTTARRERRPGPMHDALFDPQLTALLLHQQRAQVQPAMQRLWDYYRNEVELDPAGADAPHLAAQAKGLPPRLSRPTALAGRSDTMPREIVIENDIAWRVHTLVDFMFGKPVTIQSLADDPQLAQDIERILQTVFDANGGINFFQNAALLGSVYGFVDLLLRVDRLPPIQPSRQPSHEPDTPRDGSATGRSPDDRAPSETPHLDRALRHASNLLIETVEAPRAIPLLNPANYRLLDGYMLHYTQQLNRVEHAGFLRRLVGADGVARGQQATVDVTEQWTARHLRVYHGDRLARSMPNPLGRLPLVHIQNLPQPFFYEGLSEVEPLIPLQDELNTRLSDRANRVTLQSFRMYLGKGIENFIERPIGPGQMWATNNPDAEVQAFGGDAPNPSEDEHIREIREAMDKTSTVTAVAAGLIRNKVGNLTSENALRIVMMGLLARTEKKRVTYGQAIAELCDLVLQTLDLLGAFKTRPEDRRVRLHWPSPLPENTAQRLREARLKTELGVPRHRVLAELGYPSNEQS